MTLPRFSLHVVFGLLLFLSPFLITILMLIFMLNKIGFPVPLLPLPLLSNTNKAQGQVLQSLAVEMDVFTSEGSSFRQGY